MKKEDLTQIKLTLYLKELEKVEQFKTKASRRKRIIKTAVEINKIENRKIQIVLKVGSLKDQQN